MSTVRIQVRRGTASEWTSANPTLAAGELGVETDTRKIKVGTGSTAWTSLSYIASDAPGITEIAQDAIDQALSMGSGLTKSYNDGTNTISLGIDSTVVALKSYVDDSVNGLQNTVTSDYVLLADVGNAGGPAKLDADGNLLVPKSSIILEGSSADAFETTLTVTNPTADQTITFPNATGIVVLDTTVDEMAQDAVSTALVPGTGITKSYNDGSNTITLGVDTAVIATVQALNSVVSSLNIHPAVNLSTTAPLVATYAAGSADNGNGTGIGARLTMNSTGILTIDGLEATAGFRVLVKDQANLIHNGIYEVTTAGAVGVAAVLTRAPDYNNSDVNTPLDVSKGDVVFVMSGTDNGLKQFSQIYSGTNADGSVKIGSENIDFTQISGTASFTAGSGITKNGNEITIDDTVVVTVSDANATYLSISDASSTYLSLTDASSTYLTQSSAGDIYIPINTTGIVNSQISASADIHPDKILGDAITKADTGTVTNTMLAGEITNSKLFGGITNDKLAGSISNDKLAGSITGDKLADTTVGNSKLSGGITSDKLAGSIGNALLSNSTISGKALGTNLDALTIGTGLTGTSYNGSSAVTVAVDSTIATKTYADTAVTNHEADTTSVHGIADTAELATKAYADGAVSTHSSDTTSVHGITDTAQLALLNAATQQFTGDMGITGDLVVTGDVTVNGGSFVASATTITIEDNLVQLAHQNAGNTVDLGIVVGYNESSTAKHSGIVRDVSADKWKLFKGVTTEPTTTVDFTQGSLDDLEVNNITAAGVVFSDGTQTKEGVPSRTPIISKTANYTLSAASERDSLIEVNSTDPVTITIPTNSAVAFPVGTTLDILGVNTGLITIAGDTGVTVNATPGLKLRTQWSSATLFKRAENSWVVYGDLKS
jgi:hypothetical protein